MGGVFTLEKNTRINLEGSELRLRKKIGATGWQLEEKSTDRIIEMQESDLFEAYFEGKLSFLGEASSKAKAKVHIQLSDLEKDEIAWRLPFVKGVLNLPISKVSFEPAIMEVWNNLQEQQALLAVNTNLVPSLAKRRKRTHPPGWVTVYRWRVCYEKSGRDACALLNRNWNKSENPDPELTEIIDDSLEEVYLTGERNTLQDVIDHAKYKAKEANEKRETLGIPLLDPPSRRNVKKALDEKL
jgi:hypothetical protein